MGGRYTRRRCRWQLGVTLGRLLPYSTPLGTMYAGTSIVPGNTVHGQWAQNLGAIIAPKMQGYADDHFVVVQADITTGDVRVVCQLLESPADVVVVQVDGAAWVRSC